MEINWILCEDRMPIVGEQCIVSIEDDSGDSSYFYSNVGWYIPSIDKWVVDNELCGNVKAWMPLPRPYKPPNISCIECEYLNFKTSYGICGRQGRIVNSNSKCRFGKRKKNDGLYGSDSR